MLLLCECYERNVDRSVNILHSISKHTRCGDHEWHASCTRSIVFTSQSARAPIAEIGRGCFASKARNAHQLATPNAAYHGGFVACLGAITFRQQRGCDVTFLLQCKFNLHSAILQQSCIVSA